MMPTYAHADRHVLAGERPPRAAGSGRSARPREPASSEMGRRPQVPPANQVAPETPAVAIPKEQQEPVPGWPRNPRPHPSDPARRCPVPPPSSPAEAPIRNVHPVPREHPTILGHPAPCFLHAGRICGTGTARQFPHLRELPLLPCSAHGPRYSRYRVRA